MVVNLNTKLNMIGAVEALLLDNMDVRLKLPGVLWQGWEHAPLYEANSEGDRFEEWSYVHGIVCEWDKVGHSLELGGATYRPFPISVEQLNTLRDDLADVLREEELADAEYKERVQAFDAANERLIKEREGVKELRKLAEAEVRNAALRLFALNGNGQKKLTEGVSAEYFTAVKPFVLADGIAWAKANAPFLLTLDTRAVDDLVLSMADHKWLRGAAQDCPMQPEQQVRTEIGWKELKAQAELRNRTEDATSAE